MHRSFGWESSLDTLRNTDPGKVQNALHHFIPDAPPEQLRAWSESIPLLQGEVDGLIRSQAGHRDCSAILEYLLPCESRRPDAVILLLGPVVVIEFKSRSQATVVDLDQVAGYARDLRNYHRECADRPVYAVLVPTRADAMVRSTHGVYIVGPRGLEALLAQMSRRGSTERLSVESFVAPDAYRPLPTLVRAARELFQSRSIRTIWRARAATDPAVAAINGIAHAAARERTRHLVLVTGVPGSGKTLVGLRAVHSEALDDLAVPRAGGKTTSAGTFLSGNGPLVQVLQYELRRAGGDGKAFVRGVKDYLDSHVPRPERIPGEHVLVFDEAQRAFSEGMVAKKHPQWPRAILASEPALFVRLGERIPEWCVLVGLIGQGQEIHEGEEGGLGLWREAVERSGNPRGWTVHAPPSLRPVFEGATCGLQWEERLNLDVELRFHLTSQVHDLVAGIVDGRDASENRAVADGLWHDDVEMPGGVRLWITRSLDGARAYLRERYREDPDARYGLLASSRDKCLERGFGIRNSFMARQPLQTRLGPWYSDGEESPASCRHLHVTITEFEAQGLELDNVLLAWGTDFVRSQGRWSIELATRFQAGSQVVDPHRLRVNAYRVLLTRGRDGVVIFVPPLQVLDETFRYLVASGCRVLDHD